jgi:hypothetical protein
LAKSFAIIELSILLFACYSRSIFYRSSHLILCNAMKTSAKAFRCVRWITTSLFVLFGLAWFVMEAEAQRRGGGSFGGARRSPLNAPSRPATPPPSIGGAQRSMIPPAPSAMQPRSSFGGTRKLQPAAANYQRSYGVPRQSAPVSVPGASSPYIVHRYGGFTDGLMMGYLMGQTSMMWSMPFHPAFYYSRPVYVQNPDGTTEVYPPTFSFTKLLITLAIIGLIVGAIVYFMRRRAAEEPQSSFS